MIPAFVLLFGVFVLAIYAAVAAFVAVPLALAVSYAPYVLYALARKRPKLRPLRQLGVFALAWVVTTGLTMFLFLTNSDFSAGDGHMHVFGIDVMSPWLLGPPALAVLLVPVAGELTLLALRRALPAPQEGPSDPTSQ